MIKNLIDCDSFVDYKNFVNYTCLVIQKVTIDIIIDFIIEEFVIYMNVARGLIV